MSAYPIPDGVDPIILERAIDLQLLRSGWTFIHDEEGQNPTAVEFEPDLDPVEERALAKIFAYAVSFAQLETPPDWANWTYQQVENHITNAILNGWSLADVEVQIDALPGTVDGMRTGLRQIATALVAIRGILVTMAKAILYIRNLIISLRG